MNRAVLILDGPQPRAQAIHWINKAPPLTRIEFKGPKRSLEQNDKMWATLTDISRQVDWFGQRYSPADWKDFFMHALKRARWMPMEEGGMVPVGMHSSDLAKEEMSDLIELMLAFGAQHGVVFADALTAAPANDPPTAEQTAQSEADQGAGEPNKLSGNGQGGDLLTRAAPKPTLGERVNAVKVAMAKAETGAELDKIWWLAAQLRKECEATDPEGLFVDLAESREAAERALEAFGG